MNAEECRQPGILSERQDGDLFGRDTQACHLLTTGSGTEEIQGPVPRLGVGAGDRGFPQAPGRHTPAVACVPGSLGREGV